MDYGYEIAEAIMDYYRVDTNRTLYDTENAIEVLKELFNLTNDTWIERALIYCEDIRKELV